jgi:hypothetical protein
MTKKKSASDKKEKKSSGKTKKAKARDKGPSIAREKKATKGSPAKDLSVFAVEAVPGLESVGDQFVSEPATPDECLVWRDGDVHRRIRAALVVWSRQDPVNITSVRTLGQLAVGTGVPWNEGNQARLVEATNEQKVFSPFQSRMNPPPLLLPSSTTVAEWERVVWRTQTPQTFCFVFGS